MCEVLTNTHIYFTNLLNWAFLNGAKAKLLKCEGKVLGLSPVSSVHEYSNRIPPGKTVCSFASTSLM